MRFLRARLEAALADPAGRACLVWPAILGAPQVRRDHPQGLPEAQLLALATPMLPGSWDVEKAWALDRERFPDTAGRGASGWVPQRLWDPLASLVSLRLGVTLLALLGLPQGEAYPLAAGVSLFNAALFHECHDALEPLWLEAEGPLKAGLQGLILLAGGCHHLQLQNAPGMAGLWEDALPALEALGDEFRTPWGILLPGQSTATVKERLAALEDDRGERFAEPPWDRLWTIERPEWEMKW